MRSWAHSFSPHSYRFWSLQVMHWVTCSPRSCGQKRWWSHHAARCSWWQKCCSRGILQPGAWKVHLAAVTQLGRCYFCLSFLSSGRNLLWQRLSLPPMESGALFVCGLEHLLKKSPGSQGRMKAEFLSHHSNRSSIFSFVSSCLKLPKAPSKFLEIKRHCQVWCHSPVTQVVVMNIPRSHGHQSCAKPSEGLNQGQGSLGKKSIISS